MRRLLRNIQLQNNFFYQTIRGAKKKQAAEQAVISNDIVNIFKEKQDNEIKNNLSDYPEWLTTLGFSQFPVELYYIAAQNDDQYILRNLDMKKFLRSSRKRNIQQNNFDELMENAHIDEPVPPAIKYRKDIFKKLRNEEILKQKQEQALLEGTAVEETKEGATKDAKKEPGKEEKKDGKEAAGKDSKEAGKDKDAGKDKKDAKPAKEKEAKPAAGGAKDAKEKAGGADKGAAKKK